VVRKSPFAILETHVVNKSLRREGSREVPVERDAQDVPSLSPGQLRTLASTARRLEAHFQFPQDVEWAFVGDTLFLLQSRRITTLQEPFYTDALYQWARARRLDDDEQACWERGSVLSSRRVSPLYFSEMAAYFTDFYADLDVREGRPPATTRRWRYHRGWVYSNDRYRMQGRRVPGRLRDREWLPRIWLQVRQPRTRAVWSCASRYYRLNNTQWLPTLERGQPDLDRASVEELEDFVELIEGERRGERGVLASTGIDDAACLLSLLRMLLRSWAGEADKGVVADLTSGLDGLETHDENLALWELSQVARRNPEVVQALRDRDDERLARVEGGSAFLDAAERFRAENRHRGAADRDLIQPRWGDDRTLLLDQLRVYVRGDPADDPRSAHARAVARRGDAVRRVEAALRSLHRSTAVARVAVFRAVLRRAQEYWVFRDNQRHSFDHYLFYLRQTYLAMGRRLVTAGALDRADDVFFLSKEEVIGAIHTARGAGETRYRASWRRRWWEAAAQDVPPERLRGHGDQGDDAAGAPVAARMQGIGGSAGSVTAAVRVVTDLAGLADVQSGEILVTTAIDPSWTPAFSMIAGLVSEEGGMLSHATVLAREYGIPSVIGVAHATRRLATGQVVRVDGTRGTVETMT
jgi:pyruvate,water dikinase